jgi:hypothetical protein
VLFSNTVQDPLQSQYRTLYSHSTGPSTVTVQDPLQSQYRTLYSHSPGPSTVSKQTPSPMFSNRTGLYSHSTGPSTVSKQTPSPMFSNSVLDVGFKLFYYMFSVSQTHIVISRCGATDSASDLGSEGCEFESHHRFSFLLFSNTVQDPLQC